MFKIVFIMIRENIMRNIFTYKNGILHSKETSDKGKVWNFRKHLNVTIFVGELFCGKKITQLWLIQRELSASLREMWVH